MQTRITVEEMQAAARILAKSEQGRVILQRLSAWVEADAVDLDLLNQRAFLALLGGAWAGKSSEALAAIRDALADSAG